MGSQPLVEKIIGYCYVVQNGKFFAADLYEGNYYKLWEGGSINLMHAAESDYMKAVEQYQKCVRENGKIKTAHEINAGAGISGVPAVSADPQAAEKEFYIRTHPHVVVEEEPKKKGLFGRKKKKKENNIKCVHCGTVNGKGQKFCGECGKKLFEESDEVILPEGAAGVASLGGVPLPTGIVEPEVLAKVPESEEPLKKEMEQTPETVKKLPEPEPVDFSALNTVEMAAEEKADLKPEPAGSDLPEKKDEEKAGGGPQELKAPPSKEEESSDKAGEKEEGKGKKKKKKKTGRFLKALLFILFIGSLAASVYFMYEGGVLDGIIAKIGDSRWMTSVREEGSYEENRHAEVFNVIKLRNGLEEGQVLSADDIEMTTISKDQYEMYNGLSSGTAGEEKETLILWEEKDLVIGKTAVCAITRGNLLYDTWFSEEQVWDDTMTAWDEPVQEDGEAVLDDTEVFADSESSSLEDELLEGQNPQQEEDAAEEDTAGDAVNTSDKEDGLKDNEKEDGGESSGSADDLQSGLLEEDESLQIRALYKNSEGEEIHVVLDEDALKEYMLLSLSGASEEELLTFFEELGTE